MTSRSVSVSGRKRGRCARKPARPRRSRPPSRGCAMLPIVLVTAKQPPDDPAQIRSDPSIILAAGCQQAEFLEVDVGQRILVLASARPDRPAACGTEKFDGMRAESRPAPFSSSMPGRSRISSEAEMIEELVGRAVGHRAARRAAAAAHPHPVRSPSACRACPSRSRRRGSPRSRRGSPAGGRR